MLHLENLLVLSDVDQSVADYATTSDRLVDRVVLLVQVCVPRVFFVKCCGHIVVFLIGHFVVLGGLVRFEMSFIIVDYETVLMGQDRLYVKFGSRG